MKWLAFLLLFLTTAGTIVPCCGQNVCCEDEVAIQNTTQNNQDSTGVCSPFFSCTTCPVATEMPALIQLSSPVIFKTRYAFSASSIFISAYRASFWQPPRIG